MTTTTTVVVQDMPEVDYHAHPALSSSGAKRLIQTCPAIFRHEQIHGRPNKPAFDYGHAAHGLVLGVGEPLAVIDATDWRTRAAQEARQAAYEAGEVPILTADYEQVQAMAAALRAHPIAARLFEDGTAEQSIIWDDDEHGVQRRARFDWATTLGDLPVIVDYKTSTTADPRAIGRKVADFGYHQQNAWYLDAALAAGADIEPSFVFVFQEKTAPYLVSVIELDTRAVSLGRDLNARAMQIFRDCTASGIWPDYQPDDAITTVDLPRWAYAERDFA